MKCVHAKKKSYRAFTKNLTNQIGAKNKAHIRKTHTLLNLLAFDLAYFRQY